MASTQEDFKAMTNKELIAFARQAHYHPIITGVMLVEFADRLETASARMCRCGYAHAEEIAKKFERLDELEKENISLKQSLKTMHKDDY